MADPLSVAGLAVGVVSLGIQVVGAITTYTDALNCHETEIAPVRRQNDALKKSLEVVEALRSRFQPEHEVAAIAVQECLESCKKELDSLERLVADLSDSDKATTSRKGKVKNKGKKLLYPFNRAKVEQLETRISSAHAILQLTLQTLGL
jgi:chromosome segregation ATPase